MTSNQQISVGQSDDDYIRETLPLFIQEWTEQLDSLEQTLLALEGDTSNSSLLDSLFRSVHTIKGSAGFFGLSTMVAFTHHIETVLDLLRDGKLSLNTALSGTLLKCGDEIRHLVQAAQTSRQDAPEYENIRNQLVESLLVLTDPKSVSDSQLTDAVLSINDSSLLGNSEKNPPVSSERIGDDHDDSAIAGETGRWIITAKFGLDTFRNGMDPLSIVQYLTTHTDSCVVSPNLEIVQALSDADPENCYWDLSIEIHSDKSQDELQSAFSFVLDDCELSFIKRMPEAIKESAVSLVSGNGQVIIHEDVQTHNFEPSMDAKIAGAQAKVKSIEDNKFIRVQADRLDRVINLLGELVVASAGAEMLAKQLQRPDLLESSAHIAQLIQDIRSDALQLRMVPIADTFNRFKRVVRDTAAELNKEIAFEISGGETELDKAMVEKIADPLMHIVRNAIDHGLETPQERLAAGKSQQGSLKMTAEHEAGNVLIRIEDDGKGIQRNKVLQRAWERGLVEPGVTPPDSEILKLIFAPGFSTAEKVTNLSGRGVGMDVVRSNIESLRGHVQVFSTEGLGTKIHIRLPLTLAIIDGFLIGVENKKFIFPLDSVIEVIEGHAEEVNQTESAALIELRGHVLPIINLREIYELGGSKPTRHSVVVVQSGQDRYGVSIDALIGQHQTVIKPMSRLFNSLQFISGSTILGNGEVAFIFDPHALCQLAVKATRQSFSKKSSVNRDALSTIHSSTAGI